MWKFASGLALGAAIVLCIAATELPTRTCQRSDIDELAAKIDRRATETQANENANAERIEGMISAR